MKLKNLLLCLLCTVNFVTTYAQDRANSWSFSVLTDDIQLKKTQHKSKSENFLNIGGLGFGFVNGLNTPQDMNVNMGSSMEIFFNLFSCGRKYNHGRHKLGIGMGFNWKNYRMTGYTRFVKDGAGISLSPYPDNANIDFSRLKIFSITFPLEYKYKFHKDFAISAAAILNWNAYGSLKTKYELDNRKIEECSEQIKHCPVSIDLRMGLHWKSLGAYVKYSPCNVIHCEYGPQFNGLSAGVMIGL